VKIRILRAASRDLIEGDIVLVFAVLDCRRKPARVRKRFER